MGMLINGQWSTEWYKPDEKGNFVRPLTVFHGQVTEDGSSGFLAEANRYHLYVSYACPWACRTLIFRALKGLTDAISVSVVSPLMSNEGWDFSLTSGATPDHVNHTNFLRDVYVKAKADYTGRVTVPILWDKKTATIVNNESREIIRMLDLAFNKVGNSSVTFYPEHLREKIEQTITAIYEPINNGVYRSGFATTQQAYEKAVRELFSALEHWEQVLSKQRYLCGGIITAADWCLFTTLIRFDAVYHGHFKCNIKRLTEYKNLWGYTRELYQHAGVAETVNFDHIKRHYYWSHDGINPTRIVPVGPDIDYHEPHQR